MYECARLYMSRDKFTFVSILGINYNYHFALHWTCMKRAENSFFNADQPKVNAWVVQPTQSATKTGKIINKYAAVPIRNSYLSTT